MCYLFIYFFLFLIGHFGRINLVSTVLNPHFLPEITKILNKICPGCKSIRKENRAKVRYTLHALYRLNALEVCSKFFLLKECNKFFQLCKKDSSFSFKLYN